MDPDELPRDRLVGLGIPVRLSHISLKNWRNFRSVDIPVADRLFIVGPNASGKSNLLDALRFLRDIADTGGGLQQAVAERGGLKRVRCLSARNFNNGRVGLELRLRDPADEITWRYELHLTAEPRGLRRPMVAAEVVRRNGETIVERPAKDDQEDRERLTQTALEQVNSNRQFRAVVDFLTGVRYLHLVPQIIRDPEAGQSSSRDPFGSDFLVRVAETSERSRESRLRQVNEVLKRAVPQLEELRLIRDAAGTPHLQARYQHWRVKGALQDEQDFSDGTLRLIGLLWMMQERASKTNRVVLLEEPELSLHSAVVRQLPSMLSRVTRRRGIQVLLSTHSTEMMADDGLGLDEVVVLTPSSDGTTAKMASDVAHIDRFLEADLDLREILEPLTRPEGIEQLPLLG